MNKSKEVPVNSLRIPGQRGPRMSQVVEKPKEGKKTIARLFRYFADKKVMIFQLLAVVVLVVSCSVYAPSLQSSAIDKISEGAFNKLPGILVIMAVVYTIYSTATLVQLALFLFLLFMQNNLVGQLMNLLSYMGKFKQPLLVLNVFLRLWMNLAKIKVVQKI